MGSKTVLSVEAMNANVIEDPDQVKKIIKPVAKQVSKTEDGDKENILSVPIMVQLLMMVSTLHIAYTQYDSNYFQLIWKLAMFVFAQIMRNYANLKQNTKTNEKEVTEKSKGNYKFEIVYVFYLPFMLSLLFFPNLLNINTIMMLNIVDNSMMLKFVMQMFFLLFLGATDDFDLSKNLIAIVVNMGFNFFLTKVTQLKSLDSVECHLFSVLLTNVLYLVKFDLLSTHDIPYEILWGTLAAFLGIVAFNYAISIILLPVKNKYIKSITFFVTIIVGFPLLVNSLVDVGTEGQRPINWLFEYILESKTRQTIFSVWLSFSLILIPNILALKTRFSLNTSRKIWHFLILILVIQPFQWDPTFVKFSLAGTISLFLLVEYLRYLKLEPFGEMLDTKLRSFADFRDERGPIIISYIYLIIGVTTPFLIHDSPVGLISLGVGDSTASIIGKHFGQWKWPNTPKTLEGSMAFFISTFTVGTICKYYLGYLQNMTLGNWSVVCFMSALLEGNSILNDNILIPVFMLICEKLFTV